MCTPKLVDKLVTNINIKKVQKHIIHIQKKLYEEAKKCNFWNIEKLTRYFFLSKEYRLAIIRQILNAIKKTQISSSYYYKINKFMCLSVGRSNTYSNKIDYFFNHKIDQYLIYLLLYSRYQNIFDHNLIHTRLLEMQKLRTRTSELLSNKKAYFVEYNIYEMTDCLTVKSMYLLLTRLSGIQVVRERIYHWFKYPCICIYTQEKQQNSLHNLYKLLVQILYIGFRWEIYTNLRCRNIYKEFLMFSQARYLKILASYIIVKQSQYIYGNFTKNVGIYLKSVSQVCFHTEKLIHIKSINIFIDLIKKNLCSKTDKTKLSIYYLVRQILYYKNYQNKWRVCKKLHPDKAKYLIKQTVRKWLLPNNNFLFKNKINKNIDNTFYIWQKKK